MNIGKTLTYDHRAVVIEEQRTMFDHFLVGRADGPAADVGPPDVVERDGGGGESATDGTGGKPERSRF